MNTIEKYRKDIEALCNKGYQLKAGLLNELIKDGSKKFSDISKSERDAISNLSFKDKYDSWYNESLAVIKQLIPDRLQDFKSYYKVEKRKEISYETYSISDYLIGLIRQNPFGEITLNTSSIWSKYEQQLQIVLSLKDRFDSSLYEIKELLQADLFDSEIDTARELLKKGFCRAAGAVAGVVLEKHLSLVCDNHNVVVRKKIPSINDYNQSLKDGAVLDTPTWRFIQRLGDLRNLCDHGKEREPDKQDIEDLICGTDKIIKTVF